MTAGEVPGNLELGVESQSDMNIDNKVRKIGGGKIVRNIGGKVANLNCEKSLDHYGVCDGGDDEGVY